MRYGLPRHQNTLSEPVEAEGLPSGRELIDGALVQAGRLQLAGYGCAIIRLDAKIQDHQTTRFGALPL